MYQDFRVSSIDADLKTKSIVITTTMDVDPETATDACIDLYDLSTRNEVIFKVALSGNVITLELVDWPMPNADYVISIQNLKTVLGDELGSGVRRKIVFKSSICSKLEITYPAFNEVVNNLKVAWKEILASEDQSYVNSYYIEISTDNGFHTVVSHTEVTGRTELELSNLSNGQYYVRGRVQKDSEYGLWSDTVTFIFGDESVKPGPIFDPGSSTSDDEIYTPDINIVSTPTNGETPASILIEFDREIDPDFIEGIVVIRRNL